MLAGCTGAPPVMSPASQDESLRQQAMTMELRIGEQTGLVDAAGGRDAYAALLIAQAQWFARDSGTPRAAFGADDAPAGQARMVLASGRADAQPVAAVGSISTPSEHVGLGMALAGPLGAGMNVGFDEWSSGRRGELSDPSNPQNTAVLDDNRITVTATPAAFDNDVLHTEITLAKDSEVCPDPSGRIEATYTFTIDSTAKAGGAYSRGSWIVKVVAHLDDDAHLADSSMDFQFDTYGSGGAAQELSGSWDAGGTLGTTKGGDGFDYVANVSRRFQQQQLEATLMKNVEAGGCVDLALTASDGPDGLATDADVTITATPTSRTDHASANGTVSAKLTDGTRSIRPDGEKVRADPSASFTYTSAAKVDESGSAAFEARSRRGVGRATMTLTTGQCVVGTWTLDNDSWNAVVGPIAGASGATMQASGGPILQTIRADGTFDFSFNGFTVTTTVAQGAMTVAYSGSDTGSWSRQGDGGYTVTALTAGVHADATVDVAGRHLQVPMDYHAALQPGVGFTCSGDTIAVHTPYGDVTLDRQG